MYPAYASFKALRVYFCDTFPQRRLFGTFPKIHPFWYPRASLRGLAKIFPPGFPQYFLVGRVGGSCFVNVRQCNRKSFKNQDQENLGMTEPNPNTPIITIISNASFIIATIIIIVGFFSWGGEEEEELYILKISFGKSRLL